MLFNSALEINDVTFTLAQIINNYIDTQQRHRCWKDKRIALHRTKSVLVMVLSILLYSIGVDSALCVSAFINMIFFVLVATASILKPQNKALHWHWHCVEKFEIA